MPKLNFSRLCFFLIAFFSFSAAGHPNDTVYFLKISPSSNLLQFQVSFSQSAANKLILRGVNMGIKSQVQNISCDGKSLQESSPGIWSITKTCHNITWQAPLDSQEIQASAQQSVKADDFMLFSEASSLPRFNKTAGREFLQVASDQSFTVYPSLNASNRVELPAKTAPPLFVLFNYNKIGTLSSGPVVLTYLIDNGQNRNKVPDMSQHLKGLLWLNSVISTKTRKSFNIAWLGVSPQKPSLSGATGKRILLVSYPKEGEFPFGKAMLMYVALHEAFHQFASQYPSMPVWMAESLASYYGVRALQAALPGDTNILALKTRFEQGGSHFTTGLIAIDEQVKKEDRSQYGAFYTKGVAFWDELDNILQKSKGKNLDFYLAPLLREGGQNSKNLNLIFKLPPSVWQTLSKKYLE